MRAPRKRSLGMVLPTKTRFLSPDKIIGASPCPAGLNIRFAHDLARAGHFSEMPKNVKMTTIYAPQTAFFGTDPVQIFLRVIDGKVADTRCNTSGVPDTSRASIVRLR